MLEAGDRDRVSRLARGAKRAAEMAVMELTEMVLRKENKKKDDDDDDDK